MSGIDNMGIVNADHGICGFTSSLYALYTRSPRAGLAGAAVDTRMMAEIKTYLMLLKAAGRLDLLTQIKEFTSSFPGYASFTIDGYIQKINQSVDTGVTDFSIALPPNVVIDYLQRVCDFKMAREVDVATTGTEFILGVRDAKGKSSPLKGLIHYVYYLSGTVYSWGDQFPNGSEAASVKAAGDSQSTEYAVVYKIIP